jgi:hypothetical protein
MIRATGCLDGREHSPQASVEQQWLIAEDKKLIEGKTPPARRYAARTSKGGKCP